MLRLINKYNPDFLKEKFITLIKQHEGLILKICKMYGNTAEDQADIYQDIALQLWRSFPSFKETSKVSTWIYRIGLNTAITRLRKEKKHSNKKEIDDWAMALPSSSYKEEQEKDQLMQLAIQQLTEIEKSIVLLYMEDKSYKEMAEIIGITESNIGFKLNQIKTKLKLIITTL